MLISLILTALIAFGGAALAYLVAANKPLMWRLCAGNVIGSAIFGLVIFVLACLFGLSILTVAVSLAITLTPLALLRNAEIRAKFRQDWARGKGKLQGANLAKLARFAYYAAFFLLFWLF